MLQVRRLLALNKFSSFYVLFVYLMETIFEKHFTENKEDDEKLDELK